jgi:quercetin dioxygenase-like cupin family protein
MTNSASQTVNDTVEWLTARPGERFCIRVPAADTGGIFSVVEIVSSPGDATPMHVHNNEDEHLIVLEGTVRVAYGTDIFDVAAGNTMMLRRQIPHAWGNRTNAPVRMVFVVTPGGCEEALRTIARGGEIDIPAIAKQYNIEALGAAPF